MNNTQKVTIMVLCCVIIAVTSLLFHSPIELTDLVTNMKVHGFSVEFPKIRIFIEPIYGFMLYALTLDREFYKPALISWGAWTLFFVLLYCVLNKKTLIQTLVRIFYAVLILSTIIAWTALAPVAGPKLIKSKKFIAVDFHSHTRYSHDNVSTEKLNFRFHDWAGFDYFFITEHQNTNSFTKFNAVERKRVLPGMQIQTTEGVSVLLLSPRAFNGADYSNMGIAEIIKKAHANNMMVIMPHWWKWHKFSFENLKRLGIDGFEVYNSGYRNFDENEQRELIEFSEENNLLMVASTDWHGWGYMTDAWTIFHTNNLLYKDGNKFQIPQSQIIIYRQKQSNSILRFIFEPFAAYYYYIKNVDMVNTFYFMVWFSFIFFLLFFSSTKYIRKYIPVIFSISFACAAIYYLAIFIPVSGVNNTLPFFLIPSLAGLSVLWLIVWRLYGKTI